MRRGPSPYVVEVEAVTPETRSTPSVVGAAAAAARSASSPAVPKAHATAPDRAQVPRQAPRVHAGDGGQAVADEKALEPFGRPPVGGRHREIAHHDAAAERLGGLVVLAIGAVVADVGVGERHHLPGVGGIRDDFLIAAHGGVEHELARGHGANAPAASPAKTVPSAVTSRARGRSSPRTGPLPAAGLLNAGLVNAGLVIAGPPHRSRPARHAGSCAARRR